MWDLRQIIPENLVKRRYPQYLQCWCPFHEDAEPSLLVYPDGFKCFVCGHGNSIDFVEKWKGLDRSAAIQFLNGVDFQEVDGLSTAPVQTFKYRLEDVELFKAQLQGPALGPLLAEGLTPGILEWYSVGLLKPPAAYTVPFLKNGVEVEAIKIYQPRPVKLFWWLGGKNGLRTLYGLEQVIDWHTVFVVESIKDVWSMSQDGLSAVATPDSATSWDLAYSIQLERAERVVLAGDHDVAGRNYMKTVRRKFLRAEPFYWSQLGTCPKGFDYTKFKKEGGTVEGFLHVVR